MMSYKSNKFSNFITAKSFGSYTILDIIFTDNERFADILYSGIPIIVLNTTFFYESAFVLGISL